MHILLIHSAFVDPSGPGGTRHYEFARHLGKRGNFFTVVTSDVSYITSNKKSSDKSVSFEENSQVLDVRRTSSFFNLHKNYFTRILSFIMFTIVSFITALSVKNYDLVMGTTPPIFQTLSAWIVSRIKHKPFLLEVRDLWPEFAIDMGVLKSRILITFSRSLERFIYNRASHIVVNSPAYKDYLLNKDIYSEKISIIPNGVDPEMFASLNEESNINMKWNLNDHFVITYTGALGAANDIYSILDVAKRLQQYEQIRFLIVGDGKERVNLEDYSEKQRLTNVSFMDAQPKSRMGSILRSSNVCIATLQNIPMFRTTYPNKVFDYMAAGRPTLLAIDGVIREVIECAKGGIFVPPGDIDALAESILFLENNRDVAEKMGQSAREYVIKHFDRSKQADQFLDVLKGIRNR